MTLADLIGTIFLVAMLAVMATILLGILMSIVTEMKVDRYRVRKGGEMHPRYAKWKARDNWKWQGVMGALCLIPIGLVVLFFLWASTVKV